MKSLIAFVMLCTGCASAPTPAKAPVVPCPELPAPPACEDKVIVMDEKGATCPANTRATFPSTFGFLQPGRVVVLCQCK